ncbi:hypothetical protein PT974_03399 [Cladobotryum mycophilum]|uniref:Uncharacterized protein n=1 Tax=Cladobotryum mycophilum TaxID=491253 RepID=A0ABR0SSB9_9HYPO
MEFPNAGNRAEDAFFHEKAAQCGLHEDEGFHFKVYEPVINDHETDYKADYKAYFTVQLRRMSNRFELSECEMDKEDEVEVAKIRLRLSPVAIHLDVLFEHAIQELCQKMIANDATRKIIDVLTHRSIWGIVPASHLFEAYWTASFFNRILSRGPQELENMADDLMKDSRPYHAPTFMVFGFVVLAGLHDAFDMMEKIGGMKFEMEGFTLKEFMEKAIPTRKSLDGSTLPEMKEDYSRRLRSFKNAYGVVLQDFEDVSVETLQSSFRDGKRMYALCNHLCNMSLQASYLMTMSEELLDKMIQIVWRQRELASQCGIVSLVAATFVGRVLTTSGSTVVEAITAGEVGDATIVPLIAGAGAVFGSYKAVTYYQESQQLQKEHDGFEAVFGATRVAWHAAHSIELVLEFFRLQKKKGPGYFDFRDLGAQHANEIEDFADTYRKPHPNWQPTSDLETLKLFLGYQIDILRGLDSFFNKTL